MITIHSRTKPERLPTKLQIAGACAYARLRGRNFKPFVSIRLREIQSNSDPITWRYLLGEYNVTDDVSRGISAQSDRKMPTRSRKGTQKAQQYKIKVIPKICII